MLVGLQITPRLRCKQTLLTLKHYNEELRKNFNKLCFVEIVATDCGYFFNQKSSKRVKLSQLTHLMSLIFSYTL